MAYAQNQYFPPNAISGSTFVYHPAATGPFPGEAPFCSSSSGNIPIGNPHYQQAVPPYVRPVSASFQAPPAVARRRSSNSYPYPISAHDAPRSPTRSRFNAPSHPPMPAPPHHYETHHSSMTRNRRDSTTVGPDRHHRTYGRATQDENQPRSNVKLPPADEEHDPSNHIVVPQGIFEEPASSSEFFYRYPPILFIQAGFPEKGVNVGKMASCRPPTLKGDEDLVFKEVVEREVKVQINWPGYPPFERRIKTLRGALPRGVMAAKVANMVLDFAAYLQQKRIQIQRSQDFWTICDRPGAVGFDASNLLITQLFHCGGCHWQAELWVPMNAN